MAIFCSSFQSALKILITTFGILAELSAFGLIVELRARAETHKMLQLGQRLIECKTVIEYSPMKSQVDKSDSLDR